MKISIKKLSKTLRGKFRFVETAYIFGSSKDGIVSHDSDIDIAVMLNEAVLKNNPVIGLEMETELQELYKCNVDVVILNKANSILRHEVLSTGKRLFERNAVRRAIDELCICKDYFDIKYYQQKRINYGKQTNHISSSK